MAQAEIGALRVTLALNAGEFERGLGKAGQRLDRFKGRAGAAVQAATKAFTVLSATGVAAMGALSIAVKKTIDDADKISKISQSVGVPVEQLSRLKLAAELSDVSIEQLSDGIARLARNMTDLAGGAGEEARRAFDALGITVQNVDGTLRNTTEVMGDVANKFSTMNDGAAKTAFSMQIFGRAGKELIPMLNEGADGIAALEREADALGVTFSTKTAKEAEVFNDNLTIMKAVAQGLVTRVTSKLLPILKRLSEHFLAVARDGKWLGQVAEGIVSVFKFVAKHAAETVLTFSRLVAEFQALGVAASLFANGEFTQGIDAITAAGAETDRKFKELRETLTGIFDGPSEDTIAFSDLWKRRFDDIVIPSTKAATEAIREQQNLMREGQAVFEQTRTPMELLGLEQQRLSELLKAGAVDTKTWARANSQAVGVAANAYAGLASDASQALSDLFGESKAFAIAQAIINTAQAITATLAQYGATPIGLAAAGVAAVAGAAQIAAISRTSKGGGGGSPTTPSGSAASAASAPGASGGGGNRSLFVQGVEPDNKFTGTQVRELAEQLVDFQKDGGTVVFAS